MSSISNYEAIVEELTDVDDQWYSIDFEDEEGVYGWVQEVKNTFGHRCEIVIGTRENGTKHLYVDGTDEDTTVWKDTTGGIAESSEGVRVRAIRPVDYEVMFS